MHPHSYAGCYAQYHLDGNFKTLSIQPGISEYEPPRKKQRAKGKLRFAIYGDGKLMQQIENVRSGGIAADWKVDTEGVKTLMLIMQRDGDSYGDTHRVSGRIHLLEK